MLEVLKKHPTGSASVLQLSQALGMSANTIRRYTLALEKQGQIIRYHGGAILTHSTTTHKDSLLIWETLHVHQKERIAQEAIQHVSEHTIVFIDLGSTCKKVLETLVHIPHITIITPYLDIKEIARDMDNTTQIIIPCGVYNKRTHGVYGIFTEDFFKDIKPDLAFIGVNGISEMGLSINNIHETGYKRMVIQETLQSIVLADSSKLHKNGISVIASIDDVALVITNDTPDTNTLSFLDTNKTVFV